MMNQKRASNFLASRGIAVFTMLLLAMMGCDGTGPSQRNDLSAMDTAVIHIGPNRFNVWVASKRDERRLGLMQVTEEELTPIAEDPTLETPETHRGMLFVFPDERTLSFWMRNTITALDIAYIRSDGEIVSTHTMAPLETRSWISAEPARYALEVLAGTLQQLGIQAGDHVEIPESVLKDQAR